MYSLNKMLCYFCRTPWFSFTSILQALTRRLFLSLVASCRWNGLPGDGGNVWEQRWRSMRKSKLLEEELLGKLLSLVKFCSWSGLHTYALPTACVQIRFRLKNFPTWGSQMCEEVEDMPRKVTISSLNVTRQI